MSLHFVALRGGLKKTIILYFYLLGFLNFCLKWNYRQWLWHLLIFLGRRGDRLTPDRQTVPLPRYQVTVAQGSRRTIRCDGHGTDRTSSQVEPAPQWREALNAGVLAGYLPEETLCTLCQQQTSSGLNSSLVAFCQGPKKVQKTSPRKGW